MVTVPGAQPQQQVRATAIDAGRDINIRDQRLKALNPLISTAVGAQQNVFKSPNATEAAFGGQEAAALNNTSRALAHTGQVARDIALRNQVRKNDLDFQTMDVGLSSFIGKKLDGDATDPNAAPGYLTLNGRAAMDASLTTQEAIDDYVKEQIAKAPNERVRQRFSAAAAVRRAHASGSINKHSAKEMVDAENTSVIARAAQAVNEAVRQPRNFEDDGPATMGLGVIENDVNRQAEREHWKPERREAKIREMSTPLIKGIIEANIGAGDIAHAVEAMTTYGEKADGTIMAKLAEDIRNAAHLEAGQKLADEAHTLFLGGELKNETEVNEYIRKHAKMGEERVKALSAMNGIFSSMDSDETRKRNKESAARAKAGEQRAITSHAISLSSNKRAEANFNRQQDERTFESQATKLLSVPGTRFTDLPPNVQSYINSKTGLQAQYQRYIKLVAERAQYADATTADVTKMLISAKPGDLAKMTDEKVEMLKGSMSPRDHDALVSDRKTEQRVAKSDVAGRRHYKMAVSAAYSTAPPDALAGKATATPEQQATTNEVVRYMGEWEAKHPDATEAELRAEAANHWLPLHQRTKPSNNYYVALVRGIKELFTGETVIGRVADLPLVTEEGSDRAYVPYESIPKGWIAGFQQQMKLAGATKEMIVNKRRLENIAGAVAKGQKARATRMLGGAVLTEPPVNNTGE